jgi:S-adenosylmethionine uptake transporter
MNRHASIMPFLATLLGVGLYSLMDVFMKGSTLAIGVYSALLWRSLFAVVLVVPLWRARGGRWPGAATLRLHLLRGVVAAMMALTFFWGLARLPMAEAIAISFLAPLIALFLAAVMLGEAVGRGAVLASLLGLAGVVLIAAMRMGESEPGEGAVAGIGAVLTSAVLYAWNLILQRRQAQIASPLEVASFMNSTVALVLLPFAPFLAALPGEPLVALGIGGAAVLAVVAGMLFSWGYARAEAQVLVPVEYSAFVWAALFGWLFFAERLRIETVAGAALIVAGCWIAAPRRRPEASAV